MSGRHIREALRVVAQADFPVLHMPHPGLMTILKTGGVMSSERLMQLQRQNDEFARKQNTTNEQALKLLLSKQTPQQANQFSLTPTSELAVERPIIDKLWINAKRWLFNIEPTPADELKEWKIEQCALHRRIQRSRRRWKVEKKELALNLKEEEARAERYWIPKYWSATTGDIH